MLLYMCCVCMCACMLLYYCQLIINANDISRMFWQFGVNIWLDANLASPVHGKGILIATVTICQICFLSDT